MKGIDKISDLSPRSKRIATLKTVYEEIRAEEELLQDLIVSLKSKDSREHIQTWPRSNHHPCTTECMDLAFNMLDLHARILHTQFCNRGDVSMFAIVS
jgi:hypothetical protein